MSISLPINPVNLDPSDLYFNVQASTNMNEAQSFFLRGTAINGNALLSGSMPSYPWLGADLSAKFHQQSRVYYWRSVKISAAENYKWYADLMREDCVLTAEKVVVEQATNQVSAVYQGPGGANSSLTIWLSANPAKLTTSKIALGSCDNEIILVASTTAGSTVLLHGRSNGAPLLQAQIIPQQVLPRGRYGLTMVGINWGGPAAYSVTLTTNCEAQHFGKTLSTAELGVVWSDATTISV